MDSESSILTSRHPQNIETSQSSILGSNRSVTGLSPVGGRASSKGSSRIMPTISITKEETKRILDLQDQPTMKKQASNKRQMKHTLTVDEMVHIGTPLQRSKKAGSSSKLLLKQSSQQAINLPKGRVSMGAAVSGGSFGQFKIPRQGFGQTSLENFNENFQTPDMARKMDEPVQPHPSNLTLPVRPDKVSLKRKMFMNTQYKTVNYDAMEQVSSRGRVLGGGNSEMELPNFREVDFRRASANPESLGMLKLFQNHQRISDHTNYPPGAFQGQAPALDLQTTQQYPLMGYQNIHVTTPMNMGALPISEMPMLDTQDMPQQSRRGVPQLNSPKMKFGTHSSAYGNTFTSEYIKHKVAENIKQQIEQSRNQSGQIVESEANSCKGRLLKAKDMIVKKWHQLRGKPVEDSPQEEWVKMDSGIKNLQQQDGDCKKKVKPTKARKKGKKSIINFDTDNEDDDESVNNNQQDEAESPASKEDESLNPFDKKKGKIDRILRDNHNKGSEDLTPFSKQIDILRDRRQKSGDDSEIIVKPKFDQSFTERYKTSRFVIQRHSPFRVAFDQVVLLFALSDAILIPIDVAFDGVCFRKLIFQIFHFVVLFVYCVDIILKCFTSYFNPQTGEEVMDLKQIVRWYFSSYECIIDVLAALPTNHILSEKNRQLAVLKLLFILKLFVARLPPTLNNLDMHQRLLLTLIRLMSYLFLYIHLTTCFMFFLADVDQLWVPSQYSYYSLEGYFYDESNTYKYIVTMYHSIMVLCGNETNPVGAWNIVLVSLLYVAGAIILANVFANITVIISNMSSTSQKIQEKINVANTSMKNMKLPENLQEEIRQFMVTTQSNLDNQKELDSFMQMISPSLRNKVTKHIFLKAIESNSILRGSQDLIDFLLNEVTTLLYLPEDKIVCQGQKGDKLFLIAKGDCTVWVNDHLRKNEFVHQLFQGEYFGEISILTKSLRTATVKSSNYCTMASLNKRIFYELCGIFPEILIKMKQKALQYKDSWKRFKLLLLRQISYFKNHLDNDQILDEIQYHLTEEFFEQGSEIISQGEECHQIIFLVQGTVQILIESEEGECFEFEQLSSGDVIGQYSVLFNEKFHFIAQAQTDVRILTLSQKFFLDNKDMIFGLQEAVQEAEEMLEEFCLPVFDYKIYSHTDTPLEKLKRAIRRGLLLKELDRTGQLFLAYEQFKHNNNLRKWSLKSRASKAKKSSKENNLSLPKDLQARFSISPHALKELELKMNKTEITKLDSGKKASSLKAVEPHKRRVSIFQPISARDPHNQQLNETMNQQQFIIEKQQKIIEQLREQFGPQNLSATSGHSVSESSIFTEESNDEDTNSLEERIMQRMSRSTKLGKSISIYAKKGGSPPIVKKSSTLTKKRGLHSVSISNSPLSSQRKSRTMRASLYSMSPNSRPSKASKSNEKSKFFRKRKLNDLPSRSLESPQFLASNNSDPEEDHPPPGSSSRREKDGNSKNSQRRSEAPPATKAFPSMSKKLNFLIEPLPATLIPSQSISSAAEPPGGHQLYKDYQSKSDSSLNSRVNEEDDLRKPRVDPSSAVGPEDVAGRQDSDLETDKGEKTMLDVLSEKSEQDEQSSQKGRSEGNDFLFDEDKVSEEQKIQPQKTREPKEIIISRASVRGDTTSRGQEEQSDSLPAIVQPILPMSFISRIDSDIQEVQSRISQLSGRDEREESKRSSLKSPVPSRHTSSPSSKRAQANLEMKKRVTFTQPEQGEMTPTSSSDEDDNYSDDSFNMQFEMEEIPNPNLNFQKSPPPKAARHFVKRNSRQYAQLLVNQFWKNAQE